MKVLITGSNGFVGTNLKKHRESLGDTVICFNSGDTLKDLSHIEVDAVFHCAAELKDESLMFGSNIELTYRFLCLFKEGLSDKFVYVGTSSEYGRKDHPITENDSYHPETIYEATKGCGSLLCRAFAKITGKPVMIARPFSLYGPYQSNLKFIPTLYDCFMCGKKAVVDVGAVHDWVYIDDFVRGLGMMLNRNITDTVNFGSGIQISNGQIVAMMRNITGRDIDVETVSGIRPYDSKQWVCDTQYAERALGFVCEHGLYSGLNSYVKFMQKDGK